MKFYVSFPQKKVFLTLNPLHAGKCIRNPLHTGDCCEHIHAVIFPWPITESVNNNAIVTVKDLYFGKNISLMCMFAVEDSIPLNLCRYIFIMTTAILSFIHDLLTTNSSQETFLQDSEAYASEFLNLKEMFPPHV